MDEISLGPPSRGDYGKYRVCTPLFTAATIRGSEEWKNARGKMLGDPLYAEWFSFNLDIILELFDQSNGLRDRHLEYSERFASWYSGWDQLPAALLADIDAHPLFSRRQKLALVRMASGAPASPHATSAGLPTLGKRR